MKPDTILILEDNSERIAALERAVPTLGRELQPRVWNDVPTMIAAVEHWLPRAALISLDHDLNPMPGATEDPGDGLQMAKFLAELWPVCPVIIHSSNTDRAWSMHNEFRFAGWPVERVGPLSNNWIPTTWRSAARALLERFPNTWPAKLPEDHTARMERARLSLDGLGLGDALGEMLSYRAESALGKLREDRLPAGPWFHTDDTEMAICIVQVLKSLGHVHQDSLARRFSRRFERDPERGYGSMTRIQMREVLAGADWRITAANAFGGQGSMGNGGAMRVAPLGAYFADNPDRTASEARASALVTHTHPEGVAGAVAVAVAAALAATGSGSAQEKLGKELFGEAIRLTPESAVRRRILLASQIPLEVLAAEAAKALGNGSLVTAPDTVPFCLWVATRHSDDFVRAIGEAIAVGGDCDTNAAIVGGIVALSAGRASIPAHWLKAREPVGVL